MVGKPPPFKMRLWCFLFHRRFWGRDFVGIGLNVRCYRCGIGWMK